MSGLFLCFFEGKLLTFLNGYLVKGDAFAGAPGEDVFLDKFHFNGGRGIYELFVFHFDMSPFVLKYFLCSCLIDHTARSPLANNSMYIISRRIALVNSFWKIFLRFCKTFYKQTVENKTKNLKTTKFYKI